MLLLAGFWHRKQLKSYSYNENHKWETSEDLIKGIAETYGFNALTSTKSENASESSEFNSDAAKKLGVGKRQVIRAKSIMP